MIRHHLYGSVAASALTGVLDAGIGPPPEPGHRYWRVSVTATQGGADWSVAEIELRETAAGSDETTGSETYTASSGTAGNAFDNNTGTKLATTAATGWVKVDFGDGNNKEIAYTAFSSVASEENNQASAFDVEYSDDDSAWTLAFSGTFAGWTSAQETKVYPAIDPVLEETVLLMQFNGVSGTQTFFDSSKFMHSFSVVTGVPVIESGGPIGNQFVTSAGGAAGHGRISTPAGSYWDFGTGDFTIEGFFQLNVNNGASSWSSPIGTFDNATTGTWSIHYRRDTQKFCFLCQGTAAAYLEWTTSPSLGTLYYIAISRNGDNLRLFVNGAMVDKNTGVAATNIGESTKALNIGGCNVSIDNWRGLVDQVRIIKGTGLYDTDSAIPVPTEAYEDFPFTIDKTKVQFFPFFVKQTLGVIFDPSRLDTLWQDAAKTVPVTTSGDPVRAWEDSRGSGITLLAPSDAARPLWNPGSGYANPSPYLSFDGTDDRMECFDLAINFAHPTLFTRIETNTSDKWVVNFGHNTTHTSPYSRLSIYTRTSNRVESRWNGAIYQPLMPAVYGTGIYPMLASLPFRGTISVDGAEQSHETAADPITYPNAQGMVVGGRPAGGGEWFNGKVFGIVVIDHDASFFEQQYMKHWQNPLAAPPTVPPKGTIYSAKRMSVIRSKAAVTSMKRITVMKAP